MTALAAVASVTEGSASAPEFVRAKEVAARLGCSPRTVTRWCLSKRISDAIQPGRHWLIPAATAAVLLNPKETS